MPRSVSNIENTKTTRLSLKVKHNYLVNLLFVKIIRTLVIYSNFSMPVISHANLNATVISSLIAKRNDMYFMLIIPATS